jgi:hypothetical protein
VVTTADDAVAGVVTALSGVLPVVSSVIGSLPASPPPLG